MIKIFLKKSKDNLDKQSLNRKIKDVENKIPDVSGLVTNTAFNTKVAELGKKNSWC